MSSSRSFEEIFSSLQNLIELRENEEGAPVTRMPKCFCGKSDYYMSQSRELDDEADDLSEQQQDDSEPIYVESTPNGFRYAVCPACNPRLQCRLCEGTGHRVLKEVHVFESGEGEFEHITENISPNTCACTHTERIVELLNNAEIPCKYMEADIHSFQIDHLNDFQKKKMSDNIQKMILFCTHSASLIKGTKDPSHKYFMTLTGPVGSGKTLLATAALKLLIMDHGLSGRFVDFQFLLNQLKAEYEQKRSGETLFKQLRDVDILIIDEFGKGRNENEWQLEKLDDLVNSRYNSKKITIITTNYLPQTFKYDEKEIPIRTHKIKNDYWNPLGKPDTSSANTPVNETFWTQSLLERVGARMYERIIEVSEFIDFMNIPSYRKILGKSFLDLYNKK
ncbi:ATP-binding protein [Fluviispira multicolorata]|uniref:AAA family ATPase n=1 Tax=Fluviispira multicolorata TaxID=2654512 RepID=A0A833JDN3_9BACT|nr:ATP-binding protein [Fluviispira multicolorata]KAB8028601.1 AAA family ATPase [Fluviispira multicolorata]